MTGMHLLLAALIAFGLALVVKPQIAWHLKSWQYRDPDHNHPSSGWFAAQRGVGAFIIAFAVITWALLWEPAEPQSSPAPSPAAADPAPVWRDLTDAASPQGRLSGYDLVEEDRIEVHAWLGHCHSRREPLTVHAEESASEVVVSAGYFTNDALCREGEEVGARTSALVDLDGPLGDRAVVDADGEPLVAY